MSGGPVPAGINADAGFMAYSSGVYTHSSTQQPKHEVTAIGCGFRPLDCFELLGTWLGRIWQFSCRLVCLDRLHYSKKKFGRQQRSLWLSTWRKHSHSGRWLEPFHRVLGGDAAPWRCLGDHQEQGLHLHFSLRQH